LILKVDLDQDAEKALVRDSVRHFRPLHLHAEVLLRQALGLPVPLPDLGEEIQSCPELQAIAQ
jgi:hypothetical protein